MKIVSIKFMNLNSLRGEHEIRFDKAPFTESGLFAITGPTGAGKTTILDAITAALYGSIHRQKDVCEIMTRHTGEAYSEVEFEIKGRLYRAKWSVKRSRGKATGNLQTQKMELVDATTNVPLESHSLKTVKDAIIALCGLDFNQFLRSVMLCQGDFTRFLKADENERSDLLEKITDSEIYSQISILTFERTKEKKAKLDSLAARLNDVNLLTEEELVVYSTSLADASAGARIKNVAKKDAEMQLSWLQTVARLTDRQGNLQQEFELFSTDIAARQPLFKSLDVHRQALKHKPLLTETENAGKQVTAISSRLAEIDTQLPQFVWATQTLEDQLTVAGATYKNAEEHQKKLLPIIAETEKKDLLIDQQHNRCTREQQAYDETKEYLENTKKAVAQKKADAAALNDKITATKIWISNHIADGHLEAIIPAVAGNQERLDEVHKKITNGSVEKTNYQEQLKSENTRLQRLTGNDLDLGKQTSIARQQLAKHQGELTTILSGKGLEEWETTASALPALISLCEQQLSLAMQLQLSGKNVAEFDLQITNLNKQTAIETSQIKQLETDHMQAEEHLSSLQKNVELQLLIQKYEADRNKLEPEEECPLCGSTHHPFVENHYTHQLSETEQKRNAQKTKVAGLLKDVATKQVLLEGMQHDLQNALKRKQEASVKQAEMLDLFSRNNQQLPKALDRGNPAIIEAVISKKKKEHEELRAKIQSIRTLEKTIKDTETILTKLHENSLNNSSEIKLSETKIAGLNTSIIKLQAELNDALTLQEELTEKTRQLLAASQVTFSYAARQEILQQLKKRSEKFIAVQKELQLQENQFQHADSEIQHTTAGIDERTIRLHEMEKVLVESTAVLKQLKQDRFDLFGDKNTNTERGNIERNIADTKEAFENLRTAFNDKKQALEIARNQQAERSKELAQLQQKHAGLLATLLAQLLAANIDSVEILQQQFFSDDEAGQIEQQQRDTEKKHTELQRSLQDNEAELTKELARSLTENTPEILAVNIRQLEEEIAGLNEETGRIKTIIAADGQRKEQHKEIAQGIELQQKEYDRWNKLCLLIGSENGKKFSRFAQGLTLARLTQLANRHLLRLSDRYTIVKSAEKDLELQIIDGYQADVVRPMATLSGGESFLVSLALALGLSDLASRKVQINSLFIDEGFGTLDSDTLDIAISALENLQAGGKSIGVISHVEALKDRIGTQIQVTRQAGGWSKIKLVSYAKEVIEL